MPARSGIRGRPPPARRRRDREAARPRRAVREPEGAHAQAVSAQREHERPTPRAAAGIRPPAAPSPRVPVYGATRRCPCGNRAPSAPTARIDRRRGRPHRRRPHGSPVAPDSAPSTAARRRRVQRHQPLARVRSSLDIPLVTVSCSAIATETVRQRQRRCMSTSGPLPRKRPRRLRPLQVHAVVPSGRKATTIGEGHPRRRRRRRRPRTGTPCPRAPSRPRAAPPAARADPRARATSASSAHPSPTRAPRQQRAARGSAATIARGGGRGERRPRQERRGLAPFDRREPGCPAFSSKRPKRAARLPVPGPSTPQKRRSPARLAAAS